MARCLIETNRLLENSTTPASSHGTTLGEHGVSTTLLSLHPRKKLPATSARKRGLYVPKTSKSSLSSGSEPISGSLSRKKDSELVAPLPIVMMEADSRDVVDADNGKKVAEVVEECNKANCEGDGGIVASQNDELVEDAVVVEGDERVADDVGIDNDERAIDDERVDDDDVDIEREDYLDRVYGNGELYEDQDFGEINLKVWMIFMDKEALLNVVRDYCVQEGFAIVVRRNEHNRYTDECADSDCAWSIHASTLPDGQTWAIKTSTSKHSCMRLSLHNPMATPDWASRKILQDVVANENITGKTINSKLFQCFGVKLKHTSLYQAKKIAEKLIHGDEDASYASLPGYCEVLKTHIVGSKAHYVWGSAREDPERPIQFKSVFMALKTMIDGFIGGCRGLIGVDGCHLKGKYGGVVISAIALDGDNQIFPIAYGVFENECKATWSSFFFQLKQMLTDTERDNWCIISDRQKGVEPALGEVWPTVSRRYCCNHLYTNFKKNYPGQRMHDLFWACCKAYSVFKFKKAMEKVEKAAGLGAVRWLQGIGDMDCWARHRYGPNLHSPETTSNFVKSFNASLGMDRCLPILTLLEGIRCSCMGCHCKRQEEVKQLPNRGISKDAQASLDLAIKESRKLEIFQASELEYEVKEGNSCLPVNIPNRTCACGEWQISGIPCRHAVRVIAEIRGYPELYVSLVLDGHAAEDVRS